MRTYFCAAFAAIIVGSLYWIFAEEGQSPSESLPAEEYANSSVSLSQSEPSAEDLALDKASPQRPTLSREDIDVRSTLQSDIGQLANCHATYSCPQDFSDPRASDIKQGRMLAEKIREYTEFHQERDYFDEQSAEMARSFLDHPDGFVQEAAIDLMSMQYPSEENGLALVESLKDGYDAKIMEQAMKELQRYPSLKPEVSGLLADSLKTGSFFVAQEVALNILPHLNMENLGLFESVAGDLPQNSVRAKALKSNIREFKLRQSNG